MKKFFLLALTMAMLLTCVACSAPAEESSNLTPKRPLTADLPLDMRPLTQNHGDIADIEPTPFPKNDPRKQYLENKYGVTAYLVAENPSGAHYTYFTLEGYEGIFQLYTREDLLALNVPEENIPAEYVDTAYFTVAYGDMVSYFAKSSTASGVKVERIIVQYRGSWYTSFKFDLEKDFAACLAETENAAQRRFQIYIYGDFSDPNNPGPMTQELEKLNFSGTVTFYHILQDISALSNDDLISYKYRDYLQLFTTQTYK